MNNTEIANACHNLLTDSEHAKALIEAIWELGKMDNTADYGLVLHPSELGKPENDDAHRIICDIIQDHDTVSGLLSILSDKIEKIEKTAQMLDEVIDHLNLDTLIE